MVAVQWGKILEESKKMPGFTPVPDGDYAVKITECEVKTTGKGETMFRYKAQITEGPHRNRTLFGNLVVPGVAAEKFEQRAGFFVRDCRALGFPDSYLATEPEPMAMAKDMVGKTFTAAVVIEDYKGQPKNNLKRIKPAGLPGGGAVGAPAGYSAAPTYSAPPAAAVPPAPTGSGMDEFAPAAQPAPAAAPPEPPAAPPTPPQSSGTVPPLPPSPFA